MKLTLADRVQSLEREGNERWMNRIGKQNDNLNEKPKSNRSIKEKLSLLNQSQEKWKNRVDSKSDCEKLTVEWQMGETSTKYSDVKENIRDRKANRSFYVPIVKAQELDDVKRKEIGTKAYRPILKSLGRSKTINSTSLKKDKKRSFSPLNSCNSGDSNNDGLEGTSFDLMTGFKLFYDSSEDLNDKKKNNRKVGNEKVKREQPNYLTDIEKKSNESTEPEDLKIISNFRLNLSRPTPRHNTSSSLRHLLEMEEKVKEIPKAKTENKKQGKNGMNKHLCLEARAGLRTKLNLSEITLKRMDGMSTPASSLQPYKHPMLLQCKGRRFCHLRLVEPIAISLNSGDAFLLVLKNQLFMWIGRFTNRVEKCRCQEAFDYIQRTHDLGCIIPSSGKCGSNDIKSYSGSYSQIIDEVTDRMSENGNVRNNLFWKTLGGDYGCVNTAGKPDEDEKFEIAIFETNIVYEYTDGKLIPLEEYCGHVPSYKAMKSDKILLFDFGSEFYLWFGRFSRFDSRKSAEILAEQLYESGYDYSNCRINPLFIGKSFEDTEFKSKKGRPKWTLFAKQNENMETVLFRSKFRDWPQDSLETKNDLTSNKMEDEEKEEEKRAEEEKIKENLLNLDEQLPLEIVGQIEALDSYDEVDLYKLNNPIEVNEKNSTANQTGWNEERGNMETFFRTKVVAEGYDVFNGVGHRIIYSDDHRVMSIQTDTKQLYQLNTIKEDWSKSIEKDINHCVTEIDITQSNFQTFYDNHSYLIKWTYFVNIATNRLGINKNFNPFQSKDNNSDNLLLITSTTNGKNVSNDLTVTPKRKTETGRKINFFGRVLYFLWNGSQVSTKQCGLNNLFVHEYLKKKEDKLRHCICIRQGEEPLVFLRLFHLLILSSKQPSPLFLQEVSILDVDGNRSTSENNTFIIQSVQHLAMNDVPINRLRIEIEQNNFQIQHPTKIDSSSQLIENIFSQQYSVKIEENFRRSIQRNIVNVFGAHLEKSNDKLKASLPDTQMFIQLKRCLPSLTLYSHQTHNNGVNYRYEKHLLQEFYGNYPIIILIIQIHRNKNDEKRNGVWLLNNMDGKNTTNFLFDENYTDNLMRKFLVFSLIKLCEKHNYSLEDSWCYNGKMIPWDELLHEEATKDEQYFRSLTSMLTECKMNDADNLSIEELRELHQQQSAFYSIYRLKDKSFFELFNMSKKEFRILPAWKQIREKRKVNLF
ncbi:hypothetical protein SNEBB_002909 [Seison nebaliae]|nr:hypothetical protein SNEBB_002909 [Seison nebaliae]